MTKKKLDTIKKNSKTTLLFSVSSALFRMGHLLFLPRLSAVLDDVRHVSHTHPCSSAAPVMQEASSNVIRSRPQVRGAGHSCPVTDLKPRHRSSSSSGDRKTHIIRTTNPFFQLKPVQIKPVLVETVFHRMWP